MQSTTIEATTIERWLSLFISRDQVTELRMLPLPREKVSCGFYDGQHLADMARQAKYESGRCAGVYFTPNPLKPETLSRRPNRTAVGKPNKGSMSHDADVARRKWLIIDIDPQRAKGHEKESSSDSEKSAARDLMAEVASLLERAGWLPPICVDSGNGFHAYYRLADADPQQTAIPTLLKSLSAVFSSQFPGAHIDTAIGNPARIMKVPGTLACKGTSTADRPHRMSVILSEGDPSATPSLPASGSLIAHTIGICETLAPPAKPVNRVFPTDAERPALPARLSSPGTSHYGARVLHDELAKIGGAAQGHRNTTLFAAACNILEVVAGGDIDAVEADAAIRSAAESIGLDGTEIGQTLRSASEHVAGNARGSTVANNGQRLDLPDLPGWEAHSAQGDDAASLPVVVAKPAQPKPSGPAQLRNYRVETSGTGEQREVGRPLGEITAEILAKAGGWPKRNGSQLFIEQTSTTGERTVRFLEDGTQLFVWLAGIYEKTAGNGVPGVDWGRGSDRPTRDDLYQSLMITSEAFDAIELYPHEPRLPNVWYCHRELPPATGRDLAEFVKLFNPATQPDSQLIRAAILTLFWGGPPGQRPGFLITTPDGGDGRGYGKTTLVQQIARMVGGDVTINPTGKREVSTILLTPDAITKRVALVDNLKSLHFSNAEIESTITGTKIDGNKLYDGYGIRPNYMTWFITVNGANLSKDLSQRLVAVHLSKPSYNPTWLLELDSFISNRRWGIIADAIAELQSASQSTNTGTSTRHGAWESAVLAKLPDAESLSLLIAARKESTDGDDDDVAEIESAIEIALKARGFDPKAESVFIDTKDLADIVRPFTGHSSVIGIMRWLFCLPLTRLTRSKNNSKRGGIWNYSTGRSAIRYDAPGLPELPDIY